MQIDIAIALGVLQTLGVLSLHLPQIRSMRAETRRNEIGVMRDLNLTLREDLTAAKGELVDAKEAMLSAEEKHRKRAEGYQQEIAGLTDQVSGLKENLAEANTRIDELTDALGEANDKITSLCAQVGTLESEKRLLAAAVVDRDQRIEKLEAALQVGGKALEAGCGEQGKAEIMRGVSDPFGLVSDALVARIVSDGSKVSGG